MGVVVYETGKGRLGRMIATRDECFEKYNTRKAKLEETKEEIKRSIFRYGEARVCLAGAEQEKKQTAANLKNCEHEYISEEVKGSTDDTQKGILKNINKLRNDLKHWTLQVKKWTEKKELLESNLLREMHEYANINHEMWTVYEEASKWKREVKIAQESYISEKIKEELKNES